MKALYTLILLFSLTALSAQSDTLFLYTKAACGHCRHVKTQLKNEGVPYFEFPLEKLENSIQMMKVVKRAGYRGTVYLPVIFINDSLLHPFKPDSTKDNSLQLIVSDVIIHNKATPFVIPSEQKAESKTEEVVNGDCEGKQPHIYLICKDFKNEKEAERFLSKLKKKGYNDAGILNYKNDYRVFSAVYFDTLEANKQLSVVRKKYPASYVLDLEK